MARALILFLALALLGSEVLCQESKTCYDCGYMCRNLQSGPCVPEPIGEDGAVHFCKDVATMASMTKTCTGSDDCCGSLVHYMETTNEETGEVIIDKFAYHGCEKDLAPALGVEIEVVCGGHTNACYNVSQDSIQGDDITRAEACFCEGDLCNNNTPDLPNPDNDVTDPGPSKTCYNCGYRCTDMHSGFCTPVPIDDQGKVPFCGDSATMESSTTQCGGTDDCCGVLREYFEMGQDGESKTDMLTFHGCEKDLAGALGSHLEVICENHANSCFNVSREDISNEFLTEAKACFCEGDLCNKDIPDLPFPPPLPSNDTNPTTPQHGHTCYNCGYKCTNMVGNTCTPEPLGEDTPFCGDVASMGSKTKECAGAETECCGSLKEFFEVKDESGAVTMNMFAFHGCEGDLAAALDVHVSVVCGGHENTCFNVSRDSIDDTEINRAEACFCDGDLCNNNLPDLPVPDPTDAQTTQTPCPECTKCYSCGYKQDGLDGEMGSLDGVPFCNDFATAENVISCGKDDCCGMLKEYFIKVDAEGNNSTEIVGRHGCAQDVDHLGHYSATCDKNGDSCWEVEDDSLDHDHDDGHTIFRAEICLCGQDLCNNEDPIPEIPTTTTTGAPSSASHIATTFLTAVLSLILKI